MKMYIWFFILITIAQTIFSVTWFLFTRKMDRVIILSSVIYAAVMIVGYIAYEVVKYRRRSKKLIDDLPQS